MILDGVPLISRALLITHEPKETNLGTGEHIQRIVGEQQDAGTIGDKSAFSDFAQSTIYEQLRIGMLFVKGVADAFHYGLVRDVGPIGPLPDDVANLPIHLQMPQPDPREYSRTEYMQRAGEEWDRRAKQLREKGWRPVKSHPKMALHCEWTVKHRMLAITLDTLASLYSKSGDVSTISIGIKKVERLVDLAPLK